MPDNDKWHQWRGSLIDFKNNVKDNIEIGKFVGFKFLVSRISCENCLWY